MSERVLCPFCRAFEVPDKIKTEKKSVYELQCTVCGNSIRKQYIPKRNVEKRCV